LKKKDIMATALNIEKPEQPELAKHDASILGKIH
jgi:hypothetical protein